MTQITCRNPECGSENIQDDSRHEKIWCNDCKTFFVMIKAHTAKMLGIFHTEEVFTIDSKGLNRA